VVVEPDGVKRYPQDVEATVYFCCLEALNNVAKYAEASRATVRISHRDDSLTFSVTDDEGSIFPAGLRHRPAGHGRSPAGDRR